MSAPVLTAWLHYVAVFLLIGPLFAEMYLLKLKPTVEVVRTTARADVVYGIGAVLIILTGVARVLHGGKPVAYFLHFPAFHAAVTLFVIGGLVSAVPTIRFLRWKKAAVASGSVPSEAEWSGLRKFAHIQLTLYAIVALLMAMIGRGATIV